MSAAFECCAQCGAELTGFATDGFCSACLLEQGMVSSDSLVTSRLPRLGDYELMEEIARGGMGVVYKARQAGLDRIVAVKMILSGQFAGAAEMQRFRAEARAAAALQHPGIVAIHQVGEHEGQLFFSMDFVEGRDLARAVREECWPAARVARCVRDIAEAIHYAHERGVLHRDLKPSNILLDAADQPRITDFGLAKQLDGKDELTVTGQVLGSPNFMSPEQITGNRKAVGPANDVYSLGAVLYQLLTGRPPFKAETLTQTLRLVAETDPVSLRSLNPAVPQDLETICLKCLEKEPGKRFASAQALVEELNRFLRDEPIQARPVGRGERFWRWCGRNRALATAGSAVLVLLLIVAIGSLIAARRINRERLQAEAARQLVQAVPSSGTTALRDRANLAARRGQWKQAAADVTNLIEFEPSNHLHHQKLGVLCVAAGDLEGYRRQCQKIQAQFGGTKINPQYAARMAKVCLTLPEAGVDFEVINRMIQVALTAPEYQPTSAYWQFVAGLAEYRQGRFASAAEWMHKVLAEAGKDDYRDAEAWVVLAMAHHGLKQTADAQAALAKGVEIDRAKVPKLENGDVGSSWNFWIITEALVREARTLLDGHPPDIDPFKGKP